VRYLLDTNVVSAVRRRDRLPPKVALWLAALPGAQSFISAISLLEIEVGICRLERSDPGQAAVLRRWKIKWVTEGFRGRVLAVDEAVAEACAALHIADPRPQLEALIAATAIVHEMTLVTRNVADFRGLPIDVLDLWAQA
jgi:predicted nucleic acid-binding protein